MTETDIEKQRWLQQLVSYVYENHMNKIGEENWNDFIRDYGKMEIWEEAYNTGETPEDAWDSEMSYWEP